MTNDVQKKAQQKIKAVQKNLKIEHSSLVGHDIMILSEQFLNKPLYSKVILAHEGVISVDRGGSNGLVDVLDNDQVVLVQFTYRGQRLSTKATVERTMGGRCNIVLHNNNIIPLNRRMFKRYNHPVQVRCAILPSKNLDSSKFGKLRWMVTESKNISSGGMLIPLSTQLTENTLLVLNIGLDNSEFPGLIIGEVRYSISSDNFKYDTGVQFIVDEQKEKHFPAITLKRLPQKAFEYTTKRRKIIDNILSEELSDKQE